jgi:hypothetical protein
MGWETRRGRRYYYRKERVNGRVRSIYFGSGGRALLAAHEDAEKRRCAMAKPQEKKPARSRATADESAAFGLFPTPVNEIPPEKLYHYYRLIRAEAERQRIRVGRVDERTRARLGEIERRARELTRDIPAPRLSDPAAALQSKLFTLSLRVLLARME